MKINSAARKYILLACTPEWLQEGREGLRGGRGGAEGLWRRAGESVSWATTHGLAWGFTSILW